MSYGKQFLIAALSLLLLNCGKSPLFNHANAAPMSVRADAQTAQPLGENSCDLVFPKNNLCASIAWETMPTDETEGSFLIKFWDKDSGAAATPTQTVTVVLWMPDMGHGSSPVKIERTATPGVYRASKVFFVMAGDWEIRVQLKLNKKTVEEEAVQKIHI